MKNIDAENKLFSRSIKFYDEGNQYFDKGIALEKYRAKYKLSERDLSKILDISKTEVHRLLKLGKLARSNKELYRASKEHVIQKWVFIDYLSLQSPSQKTAIRWFIINGLARSRKQFKTIAQKIGTNTIIKKLRAK